MFKEFKAFIMRGNVVDLAVAVVIGGAFGTIVKSLVDDVIMPPIGLLIGSLDFSMDGGLGDDRLTALVPTDSWFGLGPRIDGGLGRDTALVGRNLLPFVVNCENVTPI